MMERDVADSPDSTARKIESTRPRAETRMVESKRDWPRRREEILKAFEHLVTGTIPPPPGNTRVANRVTHSEPGLTREEVLLEFGPNTKQSSTRKSSRRTAPVRFRFSSRKTRTGAGR
jgi:hypothetical protein